MKKYVVIPLMFLAFLLQGSVGDPLNPSVNAISHNSRGLWYARWGYYYQAIEEYKIAIGLNPQSAVSAAFYNNMADVYEKMNKPEWAITCYENAIQLNPNCMYYYERLVDAYSSAGKLEEKQKKLEKAVKLDFENSYNWLILGLIQQKNKNYSKAIKALENYVLLEPQIILLSAVKNKLKDIEQLQDEQLKREELLL